MYERQWFQPLSQVALTEAALDMEQHIRNKSFEKSLNIALAKLKESNIPNYSNAYWKRQIKRILRLEQRKRSKKEITVSFNDFWEGFNQNNNEILKLIQYVSLNIGLEITIVDENSDLEIISCFGNNKNNSYSDYGQTRFLYLGENVRPSFDNIDYALTFDIDSYFNRNIYTPLWILRNEIFGISTNGYIPFESASLWKKRNNILDNNKAIYVGNNSTPFRLELFSRLEKIGIKLDSYGSQTRPIKDKIELMKNYRYSICVENSYHPGYVTEKLIDGYISNTIPIYWGGLSNTFFNTNAFINLHEANYNLNDELIFKNLFKHRFENESLITQDSYSLLFNKICMSIEKILVDLYL